MSFLPLRLGAVALLLSACGGDDDGAFTNATENYAALVYATYDDAVTTAETLLASSRALAENPSEGALANARAAWLLARVPYGQSEAFRFYAGPIDGYKGPEGQLNGWPLDEAYIDSVAGDPASGIVNDVTIEIYPQGLALLNEGTLGGTFERDKALSTGYHAIEFLLWGQDDVGTPGPGQRPHTDFLATAAATRPNGERRGAYLVAAAELLVTDLSRVRDAWAPDAENYRADFLAAPVDVALGRMFTGIATLSRGELAAERIDVALKNGSQEDEHSCFSDNTHDDIRQNVLGIENVWRGRYGGQDGVGLDELVRAADASVAEAVDAVIAKSMELAYAIPAPFDEVIIAPESEGYAIANRTVEALFEQEDALVRAAEAVGVTLIPGEVPQ